MDTHHLDVTKLLYTHDVRGSWKELDTDICYRIGRAFVEVINADKIVIEYDARQTSSKFADAVSLGLWMLVQIFYCLTCVERRVYWAVNNFQASSGIWSWFS